MTARDILYGRRGGGWIEGDPNKTTGPPCGECGQPMLAGQRGRHAVCGPTCPFCDHPLDLIRDPTAHAIAHQEAGHG